jgi:hypothetical protein
MDSQHATAQAGRSGMLSDEIPHHILPSRAHLTLVQALAQAELWHEFLQHIADRRAAILPLERFLQPAPLGDDFGSERFCGHKKGSRFAAGSLFLKFEA